MIPESHKSSNFTFTDYINPLCNKFHTKEGFYGYSGLGKVGVVLLTGLCGIVTLGVGGLAVYRLLTERKFEHMKDSTLSDTGKKVQDVGEKRFSSDSLSVSPTKTDNEAEVKAAQAVENLKKLLTGNTIEGLGLNNADKEKIIELLKSVSQGDKVKAIKSLVTAGGIILKAAQDAESKGTDHSALTARAKAVGAAAQKAANAVKAAATDDTAKVAASEAAEAAYNLAADVRLHMKERNVICLGPSRSGKTTLKNMLNNVCAEAPPMSIFRGTENPELKQTNIQGYQVNFLDTPGWRERSNVEGREDEKIFSLISGDVKEKFDGDKEDVYQNIDSFIFTLTFDSGISERDIELLAKFLKTLPKNAEKVLVITRSEGRDQEEQKRIIETQLKANKSLAPLIETYFKKGENILFSGSLEEATEHWHYADYKGKLENLNKQSQVLMGKLIPTRAIGQKALLEKYSETKERQISEYNSTVGTRREIVTFKDIIDKLSEEEFQQVEQVEKLVRSIEESLKKHREKINREDISETEKKVEQDAVTALEEANKTATAHLKKLTSHKKNEELFE